MAKRPRGRAEPQSDVIMDINTTPLIDVMLVLLIMLIITIPIQTHAVKLNMPTSTAAVPEKPPEVTNIEIDFDGTILWNGNVVPDRTQLELKFTQLTAQVDQPEVHLRPNKIASYRYVAMVMATAQRIGVTKIGLVGNEAFAK